MSGTGRSEMKRKILIVDDAPMFRELESLFLARSGRVITASDGSESLDLARRELPDVVVADYSMPGMRGDALCREIKSDPDLRKTPTAQRSGKPARTWQRSASPCVLPQRPPRLAPGILGRPRRLSR